MLSRAQVLQGSPAQAEAAAAPLLQAERTVPSCQEKAQAQELGVRVFHAVLRPWGATDARLLGGGAAF